MNFSHAVLSDGTVQRNTKEGYAPIGNRQQELANIAKVASDYAKKNGISIEASIFDYMIEPQGSRDKLLFFLKEQLPSDGYLVKLAGLLNEKPEVEQSLRKDHNLNDEQIFLLKSIFEGTEDGKRVWFALYAETMTLERNIVDGKAINISLDEAESYDSFISRLPSILQNKVGDGSGYRFFSPSGRDVRDIHVVESIAFKKDRHDLLCYVLRKFTEAVNSKIFWNKDNLSNKKSYFLWLVNNNKPTNRTCFTAFRDLQLLIKKRYADKNRGFNYNGSYMKLQTEEHADLLMYVAANPNKDSAVCIIANGKIFSSVELMFEAIKDGTAYQKCDWYDSISQHFTSGFSKEEEQPYLSPFYHPQSNLK
jgi:hypothetical protein